MQRDGAALRGPRGAGARPRSGAAGRAGRVCGETRARRWWAPRDPRPLGREALRSPLAEEGAGRDRVRDRARPWGRDLNTQPGGPSGRGGAGAGHANKAALKAPGLAGGPAPGSPGPRPAPVPARGALAWAVAR